ncbi:MAG: glycosyltransferase family A protein, partial [Spirochaetota bacterium]
MHDHKGTDILMITYNRPSYTRLSLQRLLDTCDETMRVWLWHNGTDPQTLEVVRSFLDHPRVYRFNHSEENQGLRGPTNWLWENARGEFLSKVDDDCLLPEGWADTLRGAHRDEPGFGVLGCWRFHDEDFIPELAGKKIRAFRGGHRLLVNLWVEGSGYLMKRECVDRAGPLQPGESFTQYCVRLAGRGWVNGWYYPFLRQEHMDDPRSPHTLLKTDQDVERYNPLSAVTFGVRTLEGWRARLKRSARIVQSAPTSLPRYRLWRLKRKVGSRLRSLPIGGGAGFLMIFGYLVFSLLLYNLLGSNERVTLVQARQFAVPGWIAGDWFLGTEVGYRLPFSMLAGSLARFLPLHLSALAGRIAILALYSYTLQRYLARLKVGAFLVLPFLFLHLRYQSLVAGEWIVTLFEAKSISYVFVLLALLFLMDRRYLLFSLMAGLALSFHGMTGVYALLAVLAAVLLNARFFVQEIPRLARNSYPLFLSGGFGLYATAAFMARSGGADRELATWVQLNVRFPHHLLPSHWNGYIWVVKLFLAVAFLAAVYLAAADRTRRVLASFALGGSLFFFAGLLFHATGRTDLLTFFWFRFPDVVLPLFTLLLLFSLLGSCLYRWKRAPGEVVFTVPWLAGRVQVRAPKRGYRLVVLAFTVLSLILAVQAGKKFFTQLPRL